MCPGSFPEKSKKKKASSATALKCSTPTPKLQCQKSPSCCARATAAPNRPLHARNGRRSTLRLARGGAGGHGRRWSRQHPLQKGNRTIARPGKTRQEKIAEFTERFSGPFEALSKQFAQAAIRPSETRKRLIQSLEILRGKKEERPKKTRPHAGVAFRQSAS